MRLQVTNGRHAPAKGPHDRTPPDSLIIFSRPRAMRLRTGHDTFMTLSCADLPGADYIGIVKSNSGWDRIPPQNVRHCNPAVSLVPACAKGDFVVYQLLAVQ